jgi:50S ribosomal subunit-associated GTPase HflX
VIQTPWDSSEFASDLIGPFARLLKNSRRRSLTIWSTSAALHPDHIEAVGRILLELGLDHIPRLLVLNKEDRLRQEEVEAICQKYHGISISSLRPDSLQRLFPAIERKLWEEKGFSRDRERTGLTNEESFDISDKNFQMEPRRENGDPF